MHISFTLNKVKDKDILDFVRTLEDGSKSEIYKKIFRAGMSKKDEVTTVKAMSPLDEEIKREKLTNMKINRAYTMHKMKNINQDTKLKRAQTNFIETFGQMPSKNSVKMLKSGLQEDNPDQNPINELSSYIQCNICGICVGYDLTSGNSIAEAKEKFIDHKYNKHKQGLTHQEKIALMELMPIVR